MTAVVQHPAGLCSLTRGVFNICQNSSVAIDFISIASAGNASDFGDATASGTQSTGSTHAHGGIDEFFPRRPELYSPTGRPILIGANVGDRCIMGGGESPSPSSVIDTVQISTLGNSTSFGNLIGNAHDLIHSAASTTRMIWAGGTGPVDTIQYVQFATKGNAADFGNLLTNTRSSGGHTNNTRALRGGGFTPGLVNTIDYWTMATLGNSTDFGDMTNSRGAHTAAGSDTRTIFAGGYTGSDVDTVDYVTTDSTGDATDFGDLSGAASSVGSTSSSTRLLVAGGSAGSYSEVIDYFTIANTGNATDFGNLTVARTVATARASNKTRGIIIGGYVSPGADTNVMDYVTIASTGNAADFGDLRIATRGQGGYSNSHGGLS